MRFVIRIYCLLIFCALFIGVNGKLYAQFDNNHTGGYEQEAKRFKGQSKHKVSNRKKFKSINDKQAKRVVLNNHKHSGISAKKKKKNLKKMRRNLKRGKKSIYAHNNKKRRKGHYPKSKAELHSKLTLEGSVGTILTAQGTSLSENGDVKNLYNQSKPGPDFNLAAYYSINSRLLVGVQTGGALFAKSQFKFNFAMAGIGMKYYFASPRSKVRPFLYVGATHSYFNVYREGESTTFVPDQTTTTDSDVSIVVVNTRASDLKMTMIGYYGASVGFGLNYSVNSTIDLNARVIYNQYVTPEVDRFRKVFNSETINPNFSAMEVRLGATINLFKKKSLY